MAKSGLQMPLRRFGGDFDTIRFSAPAWLLSLVIHALLVIVLGLTIRFAPMPGDAEAARVVGVVLKHQTSDGEYYESEETSTSETASESSETALADALSDTSPLDPSEALPSASDALAAGLSGEDALPNADALTGNPAQPRTPTGGKARTGVFGVEAEGYKFVYVFDRSGSMGSSGLLEAAKVELKTSLESLGDTHQFQIIFYNEKPLLLPLADKRRLVFATEQNKMRAHQLIGPIAPDGATRHEEALIAALKLKPDVIFFLTDADQPALNSSQLGRINQLNGGRTVLHTIEFGIGPSLGDENFLVRLARENGGKHVYYDITKRNANR